MGRPRVGGTGADPLRVTPEEASALCLQMLLHLFSDTNYNLLGFCASFRLPVHGCMATDSAGPRGVCGAGLGARLRPAGVLSLLRQPHGTCASVSLTPRFPWTPACGHTFQPHLLALTLPLPETAPASITLTPPLLTRPSLPWDPCSLYRTPPLCPPHSPTVAHPSFKGPLQPDQSQPHL